MSTLDILAKSYGTDKCSETHNYCVKYEKYLPFNRWDDLKILEIGVLDGKSLLTWRDYYYRSHITGIDINPDCKKYSGERISIEIGSQADNVFLNEIMREYGKFDMILDDGSHMNSHIIYSFEHLFESVKSGGVYVIEAIKALRNLRAEMNVPPSRKAKILAYVTKDLRGIFEDGRAYFEKLASASEVELIEDKTNVPANAVSLVINGGELFIPLLDLVDKEKELERLSKEKEKLLGEIDRVEKKLTNERFISKAPQSVVDEEKAKGEKYKAMLEAVKQRIASLG